MPLFQVVAIERSDGGDEIMLTDIKSVLAKDAVTAEREFLLDNAEDIKSNQTPSCVKNFWKLEVLVHPFE